MIPNSWADQIDYTRRPLSKGGGWVCTLHMHDAENILVGEGATMEEAYASAMSGAGPRHRVPSWPITAVALGLVGLGAVHGALTNNLTLCIVGLAGLYGTIRLLIERR